MCTVAHACAHTWAHTHTYAYINKIKNTSCLTEVNMGCLGIPEDNSIKHKKESKGRLSEKAALGLSSTVHTHHLFTVTTD